MSLRINNNVSALNTHRNLSNNTQALSKSIQRLSSGLRINSAADDPAGLIISEKLRAQNLGLQQCVRNSQEAANIFGITEAALDEVSNILKSLRQLAIHASNSGASTPEQVLADQQEVDSAVSSISRIAQSTKFGSEPLLNGSRDYLTNSTLAGTRITSLRVDQAVLPTQPTQDGSTPRVPLQVSTSVVQTARSAFHQFTTGAVWNAGSANTLDEDVAIEVRGAFGAKRFDFKENTTIAQIQTAINGASKETGVVLNSTAAVTNTKAPAGMYAAIADGGVLNFQAGTMDRVNHAGVMEDVITPILGTPGNFQIVDLDIEGSAAFNFLGTGSFDSATATTVPTDRGQDLIMAVDGVQYTANNGLSVDVNNGNFTGSISFGETYATAVSGANAILEITDGGMNFQLGEGVRAVEQSGFAFQSVDPGFLGRTKISTTQYDVNINETERLSSLDNIVSGRADSLQRAPKNALAVIDRAIEDISSFRARLGAYQKNVLETNIRSLSIAVEKITATESGIRDADIAFESSAFTKNQVLTQMATSILSQANASSQNLLSLLQ